MSNFYFGLNEKSKSGYLGYMNNQPNCKVEIWATGSKPHLSLIFLR